MILTVVVAAKDAPEHFVQCSLASLARLAHAPDIEIVIVNSGTFPQAGRDFADRFGTIRFVDMPARGIYAAYNRGIEEATGRYLLFFGVDDIALPGMDMVIDILAGATPDYDLFAATSYMQSTGISAPARARPAILFRNWCHQGLFYRRSYLATHPFDVAYPMQADHKANIEMLADRTLRIGRSAELVSYFATGGSSQTAPDLRFRSDLPHIAGQNFGPVWRVAVLFKQRIATMLKGRPDARR